MRTLITAVFSLCLAAVAGADSYVVTTSSDSGPGSLRQAIADANGHAGLDAIDFSLPGGFQRQTIFVQTPLIVTSPLVINGVTQTTDVEKPIILEGFGGDGDGLLFESGADGSEVRNLELRSFASAESAAIHLLGAGGITIAGNFIGGASGFASRNEIGIRVQTNGNLIGGAVATDRNIISGNSLGIRIEAGGAGNTVEGNYFGTDSTGAERIENFSAAISIENGNDNRIGGSGAGSRNVIVGSPAGVVIYKPSAGNRIEGNYIGVDPGGEGRADFRNVQGIILGGLSANSAIGNLISNNGIGIVVPEGQGNSIQGNKIGTDPGTVRAIPNGSGVVVLNVSDVNNLIIGGALTGEGNLISGNIDDGVYVDALGVVNIEGNRIGVDGTGDAAIPNGTGVRVLGTENTVVGGPIQRAGNIISGNRGDGIVATRATILWNTIGLGANGTTIVPNVGNGITAITDGALQIGQQGMGNFIVGNGGWGIDIGGNATVAARSIAFNSIRLNGAGGIRLRDNARHTIRFNSIFHNVGLGIDLGGDGVTLNDPLDPDSGPNQRQNFPVLNRFTLTSAQLTIFGTLNSTPRTTFALDFYLDLDIEPSGFGEGAAYLGSVTVTTDAGGDATFSVALPPGGAPLNSVTATATDTVGNTSEFSRRLFIGPSGPPKLRSVRH